jgi:omega-6 fatty acid desaturase (delta-12 desaturase)
MNKRFISDKDLKTLYESTRSLAVDSLPRNWWYMASTLAFLLAVLGGVGLVSWWPGRLALSVPGGLLLVRAFVLYHDHMHGAILRKSRLAGMICHFCGLISSTLPRVWRHRHDFHHANVGKSIPVREGELTLLTSDIGAVPLMTTCMWQQASFWQKLRYRISRHPITILFAYLTVFLYSLCLAPLFLQSARISGRSIINGFAWRDHCLALGIGRFSGGVLCVFAPVCHRRSTGYASVFCAA